MESTIGYVVIVITVVENAKGDARGRVNAVKRVESGLVRGRKGAAERYNGVAGGCL